MVLIKPLIAVLATSALAMKLIRRLSDDRRLRHARDDRRHHKQDVQRWESEGGNPPPTPPASS